MVQKIPDQSRNQKERQELSFLPTYSVNHLTSKQAYQPFIKELVGHLHGTRTMAVYGGQEKPLEVLLNASVVK